jgi:citrate synthase
MQAAVAAGLCGLGSVFVGSTEGVAKMLSETTDIKKLLENKRIPGLGHPLHKPVDPRTKRLFEIARETGHYGKYCKAMEELSSVKKLTLNATGAIGALSCELGLDWRAVRGIGVMARAVGLVGHILEETRNPIALEMWERAEEEASSHLKPKK